MSIIVRGQYVLPGFAADGQPVGPPLEHGAVLVEGNHITAVGLADDLRARHPEARLLGGPDRVVMPGLVDAHQHGRGLSYSQRGARDERLELWLHELRGGVPMDPYSGTLWAGLSLLASGVTTVLHSHVTMRAANYAQELADTVRAYQESGLRATIALDIRDRAFFTYEDDDVFLQRMPADLGRQLRTQFPARSTPVVADVLALLPQLSTGVDADRVRFCLGPQAPQWCTPETLVQARTAATELNCGLHMHCDESEAQHAYFLTAYGTTSVGFLRRLGVLGPDVSLAHGVWLQPNDIDLLAEAGSAVVHNPSANLRLRSGLAPVPDLLRRGVSVALGSDSLSANEDHDLFGEMRLAARLQALPDRGGEPVEPGRWLAIATAGGARAALRSEALGSLQPGYVADLVLLDLEALTSPYARGLPDRLADLVFQRGRAAMVRGVMVGGKLLVDEGRFLHLDASSVAEQVAEYAATAAPSDATRRQALQALRQHLQAYLEGLVPAYAG